MSVIIYGESPEDWLDDNIFSYEVRFQRPPSSEQLGRLAELWHQSFTKGAADRGHWLFCGPFASFCVYPHGSRFRPAMNQVKRFLDQASTIVPIEEAVFLGATGEDFSALTPGPAFPSAVRPLDPALPEPTSEPGFDEALAALERVADGDKEAKLDAYLADRKDKQIGLRRCAAVDPPRQDQYDDRFRCHFLPDKGHLDGPLSAPCWVMTEGRGDRVDRLPLKQGEVQFPGGEARPPTLSLHPAGTRALLWLDALYLLDLATLGLTRLWDGGQRAEGIHWLDDTHVVLLSESNNETRLRVLTLEEQQATELQNIKLGNFIVPSLEAVHCGQVVIVMLAKNVRLFAWIAGKLKPCGSWKVGSLNFHKETEGQVYLRRGRGIGWARPDSADLSGSDYFQLTHVDEVLAKFTPSPKKQRAKKKPGAKARPKPAFEPIKAGQVPKAAALPDLDNHRKRFEALGQQVESAYTSQRGSFPNIARAGKQVVAAVNEGIAFWEDGADALQICRVPRDPPLHLSELRLTADGAVAFADAYGVVYEARRGSAEAAEVFGFYQKPHGILMDLFVLGPDELLTLMKKGICRYLRTPNGWTMGPLTKISGAYRMVVLPSRQVAVVSTESKYTIQVFSYAKDKPKKLAQLELEIIDIGSQITIRAADDAAYVVMHSGQGDKAFRVTNL